jgi:hypothetical protein
LEQLKFSWSERDSLLYIYRRALQDIVPLPIKQNL